MKKREENYELLRILCAVAVISIHVSAKYVLEYNNIEVLKNTNDFELYFANFFGIFGFFSVPCFVMLSGAFSLDNFQNSNYISF